VLLAVLYLGCISAVSRPSLGYLSRQVLLDVCCGTGTIGLAMARSVKRVIGIESNAQAVADAAANAARNGITNAEFICAKAEQATRQVLERLTPSELDSLVAIVDPPRAGLHPDVVKALRRCAPLRSLLFVACHAPAFVTNAVSFCRPTSPSFAGVPFELVQAWPIDLFPHTPHCELVTLLERSDLVAEREAAQEAAQAAKQAQAVQTQAAEAASTPTDAAEGGAVGAAAAEGALGAPEESALSRAISSAQAVVASAASVPAGEAEGAAHDHKQHAAQRPLLAEADGAKV